VFRIAIKHDDQPLMSGRRQSFSTRWRELLEAAGHEPRQVYAYRRDFFSSLDGCDGFMWWFAHLPHPRNYAKRLVQAVEHGRGMPVFPSWHTIWHFDDKIAQQYLLEAARIPTPDTRIFWSEADALAFCRDAQYPLVFKLASGITSENVGLLRTFSDSRYWVARLFRNGTISVRRRFLVRPTTMARRALNAARYATTGAVPPLGDRTDLQKGYLLVQEYLAGNAFDTRVTVIGNRAFAFRRFNRPGDFRASGSGLIDWTSTEVAEDAVRLAFHVANVLGTQSLAVDVLRRDGEPVINEISYYYEGWAVHQCPGHWTLGSGASLVWVEGKMRPEDAIMEDFLAAIEERRTNSAQPWAGQLPRRM
jgi:hypothetical protein